MAMMVATAGEQDRRTMGRHRRWSGKLRMTARVPIGGPARRSGERQRQSFAPPTLVPAPGSVSRLDVERLGLRVYRCASSARIGSWDLRQGARVLLSRRAPEPGDLVAVATRSALRLSEFEAEARVPEGRIIGVVEGVISEPTAVRSRPRRHAGSDC